MLVSNIEDDFFRILTNASLTLLFGTRLQGGGSKIRKTSMDKRTLSGSVSVMVNRFSILKGCHMESQTRIERRSGQIAVNSTARIRKKMRRNLARNAVNRFERNRARKAEQILASIAANGHQVPSPTDEHLVAEQASPATRPTVQTVQRPKTRDRNWAIHLWKSSIGRVFAYRKRRTG